MIIKDPLYTIVQGTNSHVSSRQSTLGLLRQNSNALPFLFEYTFKEGDSIQAVSFFLLLDYLQSDFTVFKPYIATFIPMVSAVHNESVKSIISGICSMIIKHYYNELRYEQKEQIGQYAASWLVDFSKVATEANAMEILKDIRHDFPYLFEIGKEMIKTNFYLRTSAYQNKARKYLAL